MRYILLSLLAASFSQAQISFPTGVTFNANSFGCVGDGITDNTACFAAIRTALSALGGGVLFIQAGNYRTSNGYWLQGTKNVHVFAEGVTLTQTSNGQFDLQLNCDYWGISAAPENGFGTAQVGMKFQTAAQGATSVTTITASDAGTFAAGNRIFLGGYDQQGTGFPPNLRYSEINTVLTVNAGTGVITLANALRYSYDSRWSNRLDGSFIVGAPIVINLSRPSGDGPCVVTENITIDGLKIARNPNGGDDALGYNTNQGLGTLSTAGVINFTCNHCTVGYIDVTEARTVTLNDTYAQLVLADKVVDTWVCNRCYLEQVSDGTGLKNAVFRDSTLIGCGKFAVQAKTVEIHNSQIFCNDPSNGNFIQTAGGSGLNHATTLVGNSFLQSESPFTDISLLSVPVKGQLTALSAPTGSSITATVDLTYILPGLDIGSVMWTANHAKVATVTAIYYNGSNLTIEGTFSSAPATNDVYFFMEGWNATFTGNVAPYQGANTILDISKGAGASAAQAAYMQSVNSDFNRVSKLDPGCESGSFPKGYPGKQWIDISTESGTAYKVCMRVAGDLTWVTVKP